MDLLRRLLVWIRTQCWKYKNHLWNNEPERESFRFVDYITVIGAVHFESTKSWQLICWYIYQAISLVLFLITVMNVVENLHSSDIVVQLWWLLVLFVQLMSWGLQFVLLRSAAAIQSIRNIINAKQNASNDHRFDSRTRKQYFQTSQIISLALLTTITVDMLLSPIVAVYEDRLFSLPSVLCGSNPFINGALRLTFLVTTLTLWITKAYVPVVLTTALFAGFRSEVVIFTKQFGEFLDVIRMDLKELQDDEFWTNLNRRMDFFVKTHTSTLDDRRLLEVLLNKLFFVVYYRDLVVIGSLVFIIVTNGFTASSLTIALSILTFLGECYWWCRLAEFFKATDQLMLEHLTDFMMEISHRKKHHSNYVQMRTAVMIMKIRIQNISTPTCAGLFDISIEVFCHLLNISYSVLTFLLNADR